MSECALFKRLNEYAGKYEISFQLWGEARYTIYIAKDGVDLNSFGGYDTATQCMKVSLDYLDRINKKK